MEIESVSEINSGLKSLKAALLTLLASVLCFSASAQIQQAWVAKYNNGVTNGNHQALKMMLDSTGNIYVCGFSANTNGGTGYATLKYAPNGVLLWSARFDSTNYPAAGALAFALDASNNVVVTGTAITAKFTTNGQLMWTAPYNGLSVATDTNCDVFLAGVGSNFTTLKLSSAGSNLWSQNYTPVSTNNPWGNPAILINTAQMIAVDAAGNAYVGGFIQEPFKQGDNIGNYYALGAVVKYGRDGTLLWGYNSGDDNNNRTANCKTLLIESNAMYAAIDQYPYPGGGLFELDTNGEAAWTTGFGLWQESITSALCVDQDTNTVVCGKLGYRNPVYGVEKFDNDGNEIWERYYPVPNSLATSLALDHANNISVTGFASNNASANDIVTIAYDPNGNQLWLQRYDGPGHGNDVGNALAVDNAGNVYVAGYETETNGSTEMVLIKYSPITLQRQPNGTILLQTYGSPGQSFDFQASANLQSWLDLGATMADTNGFVQFADTNAPSFNYRFYYTVPQ